MSTITSLPGIASPEVERLRVAGYTDLDRLWEAVNRQGLAVIATAASLSPGRLAELLAAGEVADVKRTRTPWRDHVSGLLIQIAWVALVALGIAGVNYLVIHPFQRIVDASRTTTYAVVTREAGLPAYRIVTSDLIALRTGAAAGKNPAAPGSIEGHYTLEPLPAGAVVGASQISARPLAPGALKDRKIVSLTAGVDGMPDVSVPEEVTLLFSPVPSPGTAMPAGTLDTVEALLLNTRRDGERVLIDVAVTEPDLLRIGRVAGQSRLVVAVRDPSSR
jgi:hypothetical protein